MSAGKGYLALAALIFGKWRPVLLLAGFVGRAIAPKAIGVSYVKER